MHTYASLAAWKNYARDQGATAMWTAGTSNDQVMLDILSSVSERIDQWCERSAFGSGFGPRLGTNRYDGHFDRWLHLRDDLLSVTGITAYPSTEAATSSALTADDDYYLLNGRGQYEPGPFRRIVLHGLGSVTQFGYGLRVTEVAGVWGYQSTTLVLTPTTAEALDATETEIDVSALTDFDLGQTLLVEAEQMYLTGTTAGTPNTITVVRGVNGTTAAVHDTGKAISRYVYPTAVIDACNRLALRRWRARDAGADGTDGGGDIPMTVPREGEEADPASNDRSLPVGREGGLLMARYTHVTVELQGDFFRKDVDKTFQGNVTDMLHALADWGEKNVKAEIASRSGQMPYYTGWTQEHTVGRVRSYSGKKWYWNAVVSANTEGMNRTDAIRTKAAAAQMEKRFHMFRWVATASRRARPMVTDLVKGLE